jgi:predicted TIM-barrel fold metal-dependent hydrolase
MLFGSDFPYMDIPLTAGALDRFGISTGERQAINRENAARLFPRLKA